MKLTGITAQKRWLLKSNSIGLLTIFLFILNGTFTHGKQESGTDNLPLEKLYLHLDKSFYATGESIWFKAYLMDGRTHTPTTLSEIIYVELIGPDKNTISQKVLKTNGGSAAGDFKLSDVSFSGAYSIRAYTNYMRNFGTSQYYIKNIFVNTGGPSTAINDTSKTEDNMDMDLQFFPEGGYSINGFLNHIAFKAIDSNGNSINISGEIRDDSGNQITHFSTTHLGMGLFHFIPKPGRNYNAFVFNNGKEVRFDLPKIVQRGVLMTVSNLHDFYKIELRATSDIKLENFALVGKQKGLIRFNLTVNANKQENTTIIKLAKDILEEGILELTLLNDQKRPIAERLIFNENTNTIAQANIASAKQTYKKREHVILEINLDSIDLNSIKADMSLSVSNRAVNAVENQVFDIKTYTLLNSVVKGEIEQPGYYFNSDAPERKKNLDLLMRTQGWRQYAVDEELMQSANYFLPEKGITLSGKVVSATNATEPLTGSVSLTANSQVEMIQDRVQTANDGSFSFKDLNLTDTTTVLLSANVYYPKKKRNPTPNYKIILDAVNSPPISPASKNSSSNGVLNNTKETIAQFTGAYEKAQETTLSFLHNDKIIQLDEAFIAAKKKEKIDKYAAKRKIVPYRKPSQTVDFESFTEMGFTNLLDALRGRVPGLTVRNSGVYLRGASSLSENSEGGDGSALILLDGTPLGGDILEQMLPSNVDFIDVIKGPRAAIYGSRGANGVIAIFSKNGTEGSGENKKLGGSLNFEHPGYDYARKFYEPKYASNKPKPKNGDNRTTLLWQPYVQLNENGKAQISFYTSDTLGDYKVVMEGITSEGIPIRTTSTFEVAND